MTGEKTSQPTKHWWNSWKITNRTTVILKAVGRISILLKRIMKNLFVVECIGMSLSHLWFIDYCLNKWNNPYILEATIYYVGDGVGLSLFGELLSNIFLYLLKWKISNIWCLLYSFMVGVCHSFDFHQPNLFVLIGFPFYGFHQFCFTVFTFV